MKVVINGCYGGFSLSPEATLELWKRGGPVDATPLDKYFGPGAPDERLGRNDQLKRWREYQATPSRLRSSLFVTVFTPDESQVLYARDVPRNDPKLIALIEEMGEAANGACANLTIVEVPDGADWEISEYDGLEHVAEKHRTWA